MAAWAQYDNLGAMDFHARQVSAREGDALRQEFAPVRETTVRNEIAQEFADAYSEKKQQHPDFDLVMNSLTDEEIDRFPKPILAALERGDKQTKLEVLETLYRWTKAEQAGTLSHAAANAHAQKAADAAATRRDASG